MVVHPFFICIIDIISFEPILDTETEGDGSEAQGTVSESEESEDEGPDSKSEEATSEGQQQQAVPAEDTAADEPLGLRCGAVRRRDLKLAEGPVPSTFEVRQSSRPVPDQQRANKTPMPRFPVHPTWVDSEGGIVYIDIEFGAPPVHAPDHTPASPEWSSSESFKKHSEPLINTLLHWITILAIYFARELWGFVFLGRGSSGIRVRSTYSCRNAMSSSSSLAYGHGMVARTLPKPQGPLASFATLGVKINSVFSMFVLGVAVDLKWLYERM
nr:hypothetical protein [Tanacetum cinerariifolium]